MNTRATEIGSDKSEVWPDLKLDDWRDTYATLHIWLQIVGKVRLTLSPPINHWWHCTLYVTARGLMTSPIPDGNRTFQIDFDFIDHLMIVETSDGAVRSVDLKPKSVADFYRETMGLLQDLGIDVEIHAAPDEVPDPIPFAEDTKHNAYDPEYANRFWRILVQSDRVFKEFRSGFIGKCSPVHFFWGGFDLAVTRFSGRRAPERPGADAMTREGYSHEVISCGFWPGSGPITSPAFYSYTAPAPPGLDTQVIRPDTAFYRNDLGYFVLYYDDVRQSNDPDATLMEFLQSTYEAGANLAGWNQSELEGHPLHHASEKPSAGR